MSVCLIFMTVMVIPNVSILWEVLTVSVTMATREMGQIAQVSLNKRYFLVLHVVTLYIS